MLSRLIRAILWLLVHAVCTAASKLHHLSTYLHLKLDEINRIKKYPNSFEYVNCSMKEVTKVPEHLVLILNGADLTYAELGELIIWSLAAGISFFSFYDDTGVLNENESKLFEAVEKLKVNVPGHIKWVNRPELNGYKNGTNLKITVNFLTFDDGKKKIVSTIKDMCRKANKGLLDPGSINVDSMNNFIKSDFPSIPDPNLALFFGKTLFTKGLLPWHIRLTEFLSLTSPRFVKVENFVRLLYRYGNCEQRFGK